jgi:hypothetical protein
MKTEQQIRDRIKDIVKDWKYSKPSISEEEKVRILQWVIDDYSIQSWADNIK